MYGGGDGLSDHAGTIQKGAVMSVKEHPCFGCGSGKYGRMHLPVAVRCNIGCGFCDREHDCVNESRPGQTSKVLTPREAVERAGEIFRRDERICIAGIAGPGEPLANPETFETLELLKKELPMLRLCLSTNGLWLPQYAERLFACGVQTVTVTRNAFTVETARRIYDHIEGRKTDDAYDAFLKAQREGIRRLTELGVTVKVNTVLIPQVNEHEIGDIAREAKALGAYIMNIMPLIPAGRMENRASPTKELVSQKREEAGNYIRQFAHCRHCRADAAGML